MSSTRANCVRLFTFLPTTRGLTEGNSSCVRASASLLYVHFGAGGVPVDSDMYGPGEGTSDFRVYL